MAQQLKVLAGKHDDPNLMLATHMVVRENQVSKVILWPSHSCRDTRAHTYKHKSSTTWKDEESCVYVVFPDLTVGNLAHCFIFPRTLADTVKAALLTAIITPLPDNWDPAHMNHLLSHRWE